MVVNRPWISLTSSASPVVVGPSVSEADSSGTWDSAVVCSGTSELSVQVVFTWSC